MPSPTVLPRPGTSHPRQPPIPAPSEQSFIDTFGALLPAAEYISTPAGRAAYYVFPAHTNTSPSTKSTVPSRVLLIHGVQTPALGLLPLVTCLRARFPGTSFALVDLWGHGLSETPVESHEGGLFWGLIDAVLGGLGWGTAAASASTGSSGVGIIGFSFGAVVTMGYISGPDSLVNKDCVESVVLVAPAGLVRRAWFTEEQRGWLSGACAEAEEGRAAEWVVSVLEGGELKVPGDWRERVSRGEVVAEKLREWQMQVHKGHWASVVGVFRDGGVVENDALFGKAKETGVPCRVVLGGEDDLSTEEEIVGFGFDVKVVKGAGHGVVRDNAAEVAEHIAEFWRGLS